MVEYTEFPYKTTPYRHQHDCFMRSRDKETFALFMEMGCGKTKVAIDTIAHLYRQGKIKMALVIAPKGIYRIWDKIEIPTHMPDFVQWEAAAWSAAPRKEDVQTLEKLLIPNGKLKILTLNVESLSSENAAAYVLKLLAKFYPAIGIIDESTTIKNPKALRTKAALRLARHLAYRRILTGNPIPNGPLDLWSQVAFLNAGLLGHSNFFSFKTAYAVTVQRTFGSRSFNQVVGYRDLDKLQALMKSFSFIVKKKDCLDLPPKVYQGVEVRLSPEQDKLYSEMLRNALIVLDQAGTQVTAPMVLTQIIRLQQIVCGFVKPDNMAPIPIQKVPMLDQLMELLDETDGKVIVWANFVYNIKQLTAHIAEKYGPKSVVNYFGEVSDQDRLEAVRRFQYDPECKYFVGNPDNAGYGLTLTAANTVIYYSNNFDFGKRQQSEDRAHRIGTKATVNYIDFLVVNTVAMKILRVLRAKQAMSDQFVTANWRELLSREVDYA